jgi:hypothetical protein
MIFEDVSWMGLLKFYFASKIHTNSVMLVKFVS